MKWGNKKQSSTASSRPLFISQVLPASWIAKFKQISMNSGDKHAKVKREEKWNSVATNPSSYATTGGGKFYGRDGDAFWRLSFGDDCVDGMKSRSVFRSVKYNSDNEEDDLEFLPSTRERYRSKATTVCGQEHATNFSDMVSHARKMRGLPTELEIEILPHRETCVREKVAEIRTPRLKVQRERLSQEKQLELDTYQSKTEKVPGKAAAKNVYKTKPGRTPGIVERDYVIAAEKEKDGLFEENFGHDWQKLKGKKIEEVKSRNKDQRKSLYISRDWQKKRAKQNCKVRVSSPRTASKAEICKIKALEDMKKAKLKMMKKAKEKTTEEFHGLESFAMVKCSYDPEKDFRDSMIEMIKEQNISQPEELEELLACYLTLNSDEYHDLIIRVFRQVWIDLNQAGFQF